MGRWIGYNGEVKTSSPAQQVPSTPSGGIGSKWLNRYRVTSSYAITKYWPVVLVAWIVVGVVLQSIAPSWDSVAKDGDFAFMPAGMPSLQGQAWLDAGFPDHRVKSQIAIVLARPSQPLQESDLALGLDIGRKLLHQLAEVSWQEGIKANSLADRQRWLDKALDSLNQAIALDEQLSEVLSQFGDQAPIRKRLDRSAIIYWDRGQLARALGDYRQAEADEETAQIIDPDIKRATQIDQRDTGAFQALVGVWTWHDPVLGSKLGAKHRQARLLLLELSSEFIATGNMALLKHMEGLIADSRRAVGEELVVGLKTEISGSAALGGDIRRASLLSVKQTEVVTFVLILAILTFVYRGPMLIGIPLATIGISFWISTSTVALVSQWSASIQAWTGWVIPPLNIFTTTKIFIVVLLFGAGTDFCLFFLARCREELTLRPSTQRRGMERMVARSWRAVHDGLIASAFTTIIGLGLLWFSEFEKFRSTGPIIGLCLTITIVVSLTFTPAAVCGLGPWAFWPSLRRKDGQSQVKSSMPWWLAAWGRLSVWVTARPGLACAVSLTLMLIPAVGGWFWQDRVSYDLGNELGADSPSRRGQQMIQRFFPSADSSPIHFILMRETPFSTAEDCVAACESLGQKLYLPGVHSVRSLADPLGDYPPGRLMGLFEKDAWRRRLLQANRFSKDYFVASETPYRDRMARIDVVVSDNPFSNSAADRLQSLRKVIASEVLDPASPWYGANYSYTGTTAGIVDLKDVTQRDEARIRWLVPVGVYVVLLATIGRPVLCGFLMLSVMLSYFTTLGITHGIFSWLYAEDFQGLDWKVPFFLFVILIAVGQDYNVYLATRVFEEQRQYGNLEGIRRGLMLTGGIITSCGAVMAGTFISMSAGPVLHWLSDMGVGWSIPPADRGLLLKSMIELGVALTVGIVIDTMVVRSILLPGAMALSAQWLERSQAEGMSVKSDLGSSA
jgi:RND superfamily putative drug exporter